MEAGSVLTVFTVFGVLLGLAGAILSQMWRVASDLDGTNRRKLTPAGWLLLGMAFVGACGSIASELLRIKLGKDDALRLERKAADQRAAEERRVLDQRQALIENSIRQTTEIIVAGQPLTSMALMIRLDTQDQELINTMAKGQEKIENNQFDVQGGVPTTPFEYAESEYALIPLLDYLGGAGYKRKDFETPLPKLGESSTVLLLRLSSNAVLSFSKLDGDVHWLGKSEQQKQSSRFRPIGSSSDSYSSPWVTVQKGAARKLGYEIRWDLDPVTLWHSIDRSISEIPTTALLTKSLQLGVFHRAKQLPFQANDFSRIKGASDIWRISKTAVPLAWPDASTTLKMEIEVNGARTLHYRLKRRSIAPIFTDSGDELEDAMFLMYEFERD